MMPPRVSSPERYRLHRKIDAAVPFLLVACGLFHDQPVVWLTSFALCFVLLAGPILAGAAVTTWMAARIGRRIQGPRRRPAPILREALETTRAMFVFAGLGAWPLAQWRLGRPTGVVLDLEAAGIELWEIVVFTVLGMLALDAWLYWKHRLLHTRAMFGFHRQHHVFRDPTPFAGFAVGPVESLLTFWPSLLVALPQAVHWVPLYFSLVIGFVVLNFYLHCGVTLKALESVLPRAMVNTSAFHNIHHSHANVHFGEAMIVWDVICKTRLRDRPHVQPLPG